DDDAETASLADVAFHRVIAEAADNDLFLVLLDSLSDVMLHIRLATLGVPGRSAVALEQHRAIAAAVARRDADGAVAAMRRHLDDSLVALSRSQDTTVEPTGNGDGA